MISPEELHALYAAKRSALADGLEDLKAQSLKQMHLRAIFVTDACMLALTDIPTGLENIRRWFEREVRTLEARGESTKEYVARSLEIRKAIEDSGLRKQSLSIIEAVALGSSRSTLHSFKLVCAGSDFLELSCLAWFESLEELLTAGRRERFFDIIRDLGEFGVGLIPYVGPVFDFMKLIVSWCTDEKQKATDEYLAGVESYIDGGELWLRGLMASLENTKHLHSTGESVTEADVMQRIEELYARVRANHGAS